MHVFYVFITSPVNVWYSDFDSCRITKKHGTLGSCLLDKTGVFDWRISFAEYLLPCTKSYSLAVTVVAYKNAISNFLARVYRLSDILLATRVRGFEL